MISTTIDDTDGRETEPVPGTPAGDAPSPRATHRNPAGRADRARLRSWALLALLLLVPSLLAYLPYLSKGFVSEDFLLIPLHREQPPWRDPVATFTRPWLEMQVFQFYRPFATMAFGAESALFGGRGTGYNAVHLAVHAIATLLLWTLLRTLLDGIASRARGIAAFAGAMFFSLYPLAPNSVMFAGSFANVFGTAASIAAALLYVRRVEGGRAAELARREGLPLQAARLQLGALGAWVVALGCYESAAALPIWLVLYEATNLALSDRSPDAAWRRSRVRAVVALLPFALVGFGYVSLRGSLFGQALGGYSDVAERLRAFDFALAGQALRAAGRLISPWYGAGFGAAPEIALSLIVWGSVVALALLAPHGARRGLVRLALLGGGWTVAFLAPFSFPLVPPAAGRYWYLAAAGAGIALAVLIVRASLVDGERQESGRRRLALGVAAFVVVALLGRNVVELRRHLGWMAEGAETAKEIADAIAREDAAGRAAGLPAGEPIFVADYPLFVRGEAGVELAQIYHYGLRAAVGPPFRDEAINVYPLPPRADADPHRLAARYRVFAWDAPSRKLRRVEASETSLPPKLDATGPADGSVVALGNAPSSGVVATTAGGAETRVVVSAPGNFAVVRQPGGAAEPARLPLPFMDLWASLAPGPQLWWVESRDASGAVIGQSEPRWLVPVATVRR